MSDGAIVALIGGFFLAFTAVLTAVLTPFAQDMAKARREAIAARTAHREATAKDAVGAFKDAMAAKDEELQSCKEISDQRWSMALAWRDQAEQCQRRLDRIDDGWYGQRPPR
jgi:hypothetical protein